MKTKICATCKKEKPLSEFCKDSSRKDGLAGYCNKCKRKITEKYRLNKKGGHMASTVSKEIIATIVDLRNKNTSCKEVIDKIEKDHGVKLKPWAISYYFSKHKKKKTGGYQKPIPDEILKDACELLENFTLEQVLDKIEEKYGRRYSHSGLSFGVKKYKQRNKETLIPKHQRRDLVPGIDIQFNSGKDTASGNNNEEIKKLIDELDEQNINNLLTIRKLKKLLKDD